MKFVSARELVSVFYENQEQWNMIELGLADWILAPSQVHSLALLPVCDNRCICHSDLLLGKFTTWGHAA